MASDRPPTKGNQSLVRRIARDRRLARTDEDDNGAGPDTSRPATVVGLLSDIVACPDKTENAARLLKIVLGYLTIFLSIFLVIILLVVATLRHWWPSVHINVDRTVPLWVAGTASATSVVVATLLSRIVRRRSENKKKNQPEPATKVD
jgi:hypothetical protein